MSQSDRRLSPELLLRPVREFFGGRIPFDAFTEPNNPTDAVLFCTGREDLGEPDDGLLVPWSMYGGTWAQPPFSIMGPCVDKAISEARLGAEILFLSRNDNRSRWHRRLADNCDMRCNIGRSVGFIEVREDGSLKKLSGDFHPYTVWMFGRQRRRFERVFAPLGEIIPGMGPLEVLEAAQ